MLLSDFERNHALWKKISDHLNERVEVYRKKNDCDLDAIETARLRGRIAALKEILALGDEPSPSQLADE